MSDEQKVSESNLTFKDLYRLAYEGTRNVYQDPDRVARQTLECYSAEFDSDLVTIRGFAKTDEAKALLEQEAQRYTDNYRKYFTGWLSAKSRCISSFITGPANFPVQKARKANESERKRYDEFVDFRGKALTAIRKKLQSAGVVELPELELAEKKLAGLMIRQELMKQAREAHRKYLKNPATLDQSDLSEEIKQLVRDSGKKVPFAAYQLTNNGSEIRRMTDRVEMLKAKAFAAENKASQEKNFDKGKIVLNYELDRLQLVYDEKPDAETIRTLKSNGFKWAPSQMAWQRQMTENAKWSATRVTGIRL